MVQLRKGIPMTNPTGAESTPPSIPELLASMVGFSELQDRRVSAARALHPRLGQWGRSPVCGARSCGCECGDPWCDSGNGWPCETAVALGANEHGYPD